MQDLFGHLPAVIYEYSIRPGGTRSFDFISSPCNSILGVSPEAVMRDSTLMESLIHKEDIEDLWQTSAVSENAGIEWNWQGRMLVHGLVKWMEIRSNHEVKDDGTIIRRGIIQDITERKETAKESEVRYQSLVEHLPIGVIIHKEGTIVFANAQATCDIMQRNSY